MSLDQLQSIFSLTNIWSIFLIVLFFGGSILVHELGHMLAARRRGMHVERFSIGFGPKIFSWRGRDGVEYRVSWLPFGGYVLIPQLADLGMIEGESNADLSKLPPVSYASKMLVAVAGAVCNILFAFFLACLIWIFGQPTIAENNTTQIGAVMSTITLPDGSTVASPASVAGLKPGDIIRDVDGQSVDNWPDLQETLAASSRHTASGRPEAVFTIDRQGRTLHLTVYPRATKEDSRRIVGILPAQDLVIGAVKPGFLGDKIGLRPGDQIVAYDRIPLLSQQSFADYLDRHRADHVQLEVARGNQHLTLVIPPRPGRKNLADFGIQRLPRYLVIHPDPVSQIEDQVVMTFRVLAGLLNPHSDVKVSQLMGPVGIASIFRTAAQSDIRLVFWFTVLINVQLAIFNLLPIPVLDGGHMLFATIGQLRGRALPAEIIMTAQSVFFVLIISLFFYVTYNDVRRIHQDAQASAAPPPAAKSEPAPAGP